MLTQQLIAVHLDMSQQAVSQWMDRLGLDWKTASLDEIRIAYVRELREQAAGRASSGDYDLVEERARLARAQREKIEMQNDVTRRELAPVSLIEEVLTKAASRIAGIFDAIPGKVRRRVPKLTTDDLDLIAGEIAKARNIVASMSLADLDGDDDSSESDPVVIDA